MEKKTYDVCFDFNNKIENTKLDFDSKITELVKQFKETVINPVCEKYNLTFHCGMGSWNFTDSDGDIITDDDVEEVLYDLDRDLDGEPEGVKHPYKMWESLYDIFNVLDVEIYDKHFGYWF